MYIMLNRRLVHHGKTTSIHGLHYTVDENRPICIRIFWMIIFLVSIIGMFLVFLRIYESYRYHPISFVTETTYLNWNTSFPAVTICEITSSEIFWTAGPDGDYSPVQQFIMDIIFFTGSCYSCNTPCVECKDLNFKEVTAKFRRKCPVLIRNCKWNNITFDCCDKFLPLETEYGVCFSINSLHTHQTAKSAIDMRSNRKTGPGQLLIETLEDVRVIKKLNVLLFVKTLSELYFHAPEDVPFINSDPDQRKDIMLGEIYNITFNVIEIKNDENVKYLPVDRRRCRFPWEKTDNLRVHNYYSYSTCVVQCHADAHLQLCNCTHHLMPVLSNEKFCDMQGLQCLTDYFETVNRLHAQGFDKPGLVCDCVPSCVEPEYKVVSETKGVKTSNSEILIKMQSLPTSRFKRNVVRTKLELVVSIGGAAGLFVGASILSIIESIYLLCLRK